jgi:GT2 family glycosyltransferase
MTVSVIVPTLNVERWIRDQLGALSQQVFPDDWELLVADSGSTDNTRAIVASWADRFPAFRLLDASGGLGPARGRNHAARAASGQLLLFTDADDIVAPGWMTQLTAGLSSSPIVTGPVRHFIDGQTARRNTLPQANEPARFQYPIGCNMGIERELYLELGGFDEAAPVGWDDVDFGIRAARRGFSTAWIEQAVVFHRRPSSARETWRKEFAYGRGWTVLERRYPQLSSNGWIRPLLRRAGWVAMRAPYIALPARRRGWLVRAASLTGRLAERLRPSPASRSGQGVAWPSR